MSTLEDDVMFKAIEDQLPPSNERVSAASIQSNDATKQVDALKASLFLTPQNHEQKIAFITEELAANRYTINSDQIAEKLLEHTKESKPNAAHHKETA